MSRFPFICCSPSEWPSAFVLFLLLCDRYSVQRMFWEKDKAKFRTMKKVSHRKLRTKSLPEDQEEENKGTHTSSTPTPKTTQRSARLSFDVCFPLSTRLIHSVCLGRGDYNLEGASEKAFFQIKEERTEEDEPRGGKRRNACISVTADTSRRIHSGETERIEKKHHYVLLHLCHQTLCAICKFL